MTEVVRSRSISQHSIALRSVEEDFKTKDEIKEYLDEVFGYLNTDVDNLKDNFSLLDQYAQKDEITEIGNEELRNTQEVNAEFQSTWQAARQAIMQLEKMAQQNMILLQEVTNPRGIETSLAAVMLQSAQRDTVLCITGMTGVLERLETIAASLNSFLECLETEMEKCDTTIDENVCPQMLQTVMAVIPWNYIPVLPKILEKIIDMPVPKPNRKATSSGPPRTPRDNRKTLAQCKKFGIETLQQLDKVCEAWAVLTQQVMLVGKLLTMSSEYFHEGTDLKEVNELCHYYECLRKASAEHLVRHQRNFWNQIRKCSGAQMSEELSEGDSTPACSTQSSS